MASRTVSVALVADVGQYQSAMVRAAATTRTVGDSAATAGTRAQRGFEAAGRGAALLGAVAAGGLVLGLKGAVDAASEAEQSIGGVEAVFKSYATSVIASSKEADRALGLSANSYRELATIIGSQMKNAGVPLDQLADKTEGIIGIGADLAAQFGGSTQEAVNALSSAFRGEMDPIERYGISLTAAAVGAKAVELGLSETETGLSQNAKAMATLAIVTEQSADAQGAFGRESDTAAGRAQRAAAQWENLKVAVGDRLLSAWSALVDVLGTKVIPFLGDVLDTGGDVVKFMMDNKEVALALAGVLAVQLAGGIGAVTVAFNRMVLAPVALGLSNILGVALNLPGALAAASTAVAGFAAAAAPLVAVGAIVYAISKTIDFATAAGDARKEVSGMWDAVDDARGGAQLEAMAGVVEQIEAKIRSLNAELPKTEGAFEGLLAPLGMLENGGAVNALDEYEAALARAEAAQDLASASADVMSRRFGLTRDQVLDLAAKYDIDLTGSMSDTFRLMQNFYGQEFGSAPTEAVIDLSGAMEEAKAAADDAKKAVDGFKLSLDILTGAHISMMQVEGAFYESLDAAKTALEGTTGAVLDDTGALNQRTEAGRAASGQLADLVDDANLWIATMINEGATTEDAVVKDEELRKSFYETALQMTGSKEAAERLTNEIYGIPEERRVQIDADVAAANAAIAATQRGIDNMHGRDIEINVRAAGRFIVNPQGGLQEFGGPNYARDGIPRPGFMGGGWTGPGPRDRVVGDVHADEFVVPKQRVNALGGPGAVAARVGMGADIGGPGSIDITQDTRPLEGAMNSLASAMENATPAAGIAGSGAVGGAWGSLWDYIKARVPQARINSAFRPGDPGYHGRGKALDVGFGSGPGGAGSAGLALINRTFHDGIGGNLAELIYDGIGDDRPDLWHGGPHTYSKATQKEHQNHVHAAVYHQGTDFVPQTGWGYLEKGEAVIPASLNPRSREFSGGGGSRSGGGTGGPIHVTLKLDGAAVTDLLDGRVVHRENSLARDARSSL